jgi:hypothetical protein
MPEPLSIPSKKDQVSAEEWQLRVDLAAAYRLIALYSGDHLIFTHISLWIPGDEHQGHRREPCLARVAPEAGPD